MPNTESWRGKKAAAPSPAPKRNKIHAWGGRSARGSAKAWDEIPPKGRETNTKGITMPQINGVGRKEVTLQRNKKKKATHWQMIFHFLAGSKSWKGPLRAGLPAPKSRTPPMPPTKSLPTPSNFSLYLGAFAPGCTGRGGLRNGPAAKKKKNRTAPFIYTGALACGASGAFFGLFPALPSEKHSAPCAAFAPWRRRSPGLVPTRTGGYLFFPPRWRINPRRPKKQFSF